MCTIGSVHRYIGRYVDRLSTDISSTYISVDSLLTDTPTIYRDSVDMSTDRRSICGLSSVGEVSVVSRSGVGVLSVECR